MQVDAHGKDYAEVLRALAFGTLRIEDAIRAEADHGPNGMISARFCLLLWHR